MYRPDSAKASLRDGIEGRDPTMSTLKPRSEDAQTRVDKQGTAATERARPDKQGIATCAPQNHSAASWQPLRDEKLASPAVPGSDAEPLEDLQWLLDHLSKQSNELRVRQEKNEGRRVGKLRREEAMIRGRHDPSESWKRPCSYPRVFSNGGSLPVKYLSPFEQQASTRPSRSYERAPDPEKGPFWDVSTYPQVFGEPPPPHNQAPLIHSARAVLSQASPRCARFNVETALKPWLPTHGTPRTLDSIKFVDERPGRVHGTVH